MIAAEEPTHRRGNKLRPCVCAFSDQRESGTDNPNELKPQDSDVCENTHRRILPAVALLCCAVVVLKCWCKCRLVGACVCKVLVRSGGGLDG